MTRATAMRWATMAVLLAVPSASGGEVPGLEAARAAVARGDAEALLNLTCRRYQAMRSFQATGDLVGRNELLRWRPVVQNHFELVLSRDRGYVVTWGNPNAVPDAPPVGAVWNEGRGAHSYQSWSNTYTPYRRDRSAFAAAAGVSGGLTSGVPSLFVNGDGWFTEVGEAVITGTERVEDEPCWVVSGRSRWKRKRTLWISTERLVIRRHRWSNQLPEGQERPEEAELMRESLLQRLEGDERDSMAFVFDMKKALKKHRGLFVGDSTETYRNIRINEPLRGEQLVFDVPNGATLEKSKFGLSPPDGLEEGSGQ